MSNMFGNDPFTFSMRGPRPKVQPAADKPARPLPAIRGKWISGVFYVRGSDVADALESQAPRVNRRLIDKLRSVVKP